MTATHKKKGGLGPWLALRALAVALVPLSLWFIWFVAQSVGLSHAAFTALLAQPWNAGAAAALVIAATAHATLGAHEIVEDYIACPTARRWSILATDAAATAFIFACLAAIGAVAFRAGPI